MIDHSTLPANSGAAQLLGSPPPRLIGVDQGRFNLTAECLKLYLEKTVWTKPEFTEMRFGFEVTMYIANR